MESKDLSRYGMRLDDLNRIRALDEDTESHASQMRETCNDFLGDTQDFQKIADSFIKIFDSVSKVSIT